MRSTNPRSALSCSRLRRRERVLNAFSVFHSEKNARTRRCQDNDACRLSSIFRRDITHWHTGASCQVALKPVLFPYNYRLKFLLCFQDQIYTPYLYERKESRLTFAELLRAHGERTVPKIYKCLNQPLTMQHAFYLGQVKA